MKTSSIDIPALIAALFLTGAHVSTVQATILASDDFNSYAPGSLNGGAGGTGWGTNLWVTPTTGFSTTAVNGGGAVDVTLSGTVATTLPASRLLGSAIQQTFYVSYDLTYTGVSPAVFGGNNTFGLVLSDLTTPSTTVANTIFNVNMRNSATGTDANNAANGNNFIIRSATGGATFPSGQVAGGLITADTTYQIVAKLTYDGTRFGFGEMWINPTNPTETAADASLTLAAGTGATAINSVYFRQAANDNNGDAYRFDNLILGTAWSDVIPEPSTFALAGLGVAAFLVLRRRR